MATKETLKTYFEVGDKPTETQFGSLIDSMASFEKYYPSVGTYRKYAPMMKNSYSNDKELLIPHYDVSDPTTKTFSTGELQINEWYRVTGTGSITHDGFVYDVGDEFRASSSAFSVTSLSPVIMLGTQHAEFEDCSQVYGGKIIEVGDYYFMYYAGNTQKYKTLGYTIDGDESIVDINIKTTLSDAYKNNSDYSRRDQIFLAYKRKDEDLYEGEWMKHKEGSKPIIAASGEFSGADDASNAWFRSVLYDGSQYVILYIGDSAPDGVAHNATFMWATSADGVSWTKQGSISSVAVSGGTNGVMFYKDGAYYILRYNGSTNLLYKSTGDPSSGTFGASFSLIQSTLITGLAPAYDAIVVGDKIYVTGRKSTSNQEMYIFECSSAGTDLETPGNWTELGLLYSTPLADDDFTGETENGSGGPTAQQNSLFQVDSVNNKWAVIYSSFKHKFARHPFVPETEIRMLTFTNADPIPGV
jgi:hypothetical protein